VVHGVVGIAHSQKYLCEAIAATDIVNPASPE
jgi:hypothetical protein